MEIHKTNDFLRNAHAKCKSVNNSYIHFGINFKNQHDSLLMIINQDKNMQNRYI